MKFYFFSANTTMFILLCSLNCVLAVEPADFENPPASERAASYWWFFNGRINQAGITRDLEEFKAKGLGGVIVVWSSSGSFGGAPVPVGPVKFLSPEWRADYRFALDETQRLGLEVGVNCHLRESNLATLLRKAGEQGQPASETELAELQKVMQTDLANFKAEHNDLGIGGKISPPGAAWPEMEDALSLLPKDVDAFLGKYFRPAPDKHSRGNFSVTSP